MVRTQCVHSGTAGSPQKQVMTVAYWLVTLVQCGSSVRQWYACGTLVSHIYVHLCTGTPVHWYTCALVQCTTGTVGIPSPCCPPCSSSPGVIARRRPVLLTSLYLGDPLSLTNTGEHFTENTQLFWHCSNSHIALPILDNNGTFSYFHPYYKSKILLISLINGKQAQKFG